jgi:hypothetical protein
LLGDEAVGRHPRGRLELDDGHAWFADHLATPRYRPTSKRLYSAFLEIMAAQIEFRAATQDEFDFDHIAAAAHHLEAAGEIVNQVKAELKSQRKPRRAAQAAAVAQR